MSAGSHVLKDERGTTEDKSISRGGRGGWDEKNQWLWVCVVNNGSLISLLVLDSLLAVFVAALLKEVLTKNKTDRLR